MACQCSAPPPATSQKFKTALWIALILNFSLFLIEMIGGTYAHSSSLWADAMDFLGDSFNYAISLVVLGMGLYWRATVAWWKGVTMMTLGILVLLKIAYAYFNGIMPEPMIMGGIAILALIANLICAIILYAFREGDANMQSVWLCSRNDVIANIAVLIAALGVLGTGTFWPDLFVALIMVYLGLTSGYKVMQIAKKERLYAVTSGCNS